MINVQRGGQRRCTSRTWDECPFCRLRRGVDTANNRQADIIWQDDSRTAFVSPKWWPGNHGHVIVIPNAHVENIYEIDEDSSARSIDGSGASPAR